MLNDLLSRRAVLRTAAIAGSAALVAGCDDEPPGTGTPGASPGADGTSQPPSPSTDPAVVAALTAAATQVQQIAQRYSSVSKAFPVLRGRLTLGAKHRATHAARLRQLAGVAAPAPGKLPPLPKTAAAALAELASREQKLSVAHATAAAKLRGEPARVLAMLAASESQLAATLRRKAAG